MQDLKNIQQQLAQEEKALLSSREQVRAAHQRIEEARGQITAIQAQIQSTQRKIQELESHAKSIEKRVALLRAYMEMAATSPTPEPPPKPTPEPAAPEEQKPRPKPKPKAAAKTEDIDLDLPAEEIDLELPADDESEVIELGAPLTAPIVSDAPAATDRGPLSFENMDEEFFTHELLPRTSTFEEELILLMAYHRKAIKPKDIANRFKRLDYTPKASTTEKNIKQQVESSHFFELVGEGRVALSDEGRVEAHHLLDTLG